MKLRNRKTGEIDDFLFEVIGGRIDLYRTVGSSDTKNIWHYKSLVELIEEWEDCKPAEPLIKDEKIRKAVRAWAEANHINSVYILGLGTLRSLQNGIDIEFYGDPFSKWVTEGKTIAELCGEEE